MKIGYVPSADAPGFYRCLSPGKELGVRGVEVFMPPREEKDVNGRWTTMFSMDFNMPQEADLWVFQQWRERVLNEAGVKKLRGWGSATSMDVDDDYISIPAYNPAFAGTHPYRSAKAGRILNRAERRRIQKATKFRPPPNSANSWHMLDSMRQMDLITVSTPRLAEVYAPYNDNIKVVRNYIDWEMWDDVTPQYEVERRRPRIGYTGAFEYRKADLAAVQRPLQQFLRDNPDVVFVAIDKETHDFLGVPPSQRRTMGRYDFYDRETGMVNVPRYTAQFDIGIVPLAMNDLNEGKSHLKGMEYNAAGIPFIASPTESYAQYWCDEKNGLVARGEAEWYDHLDFLVREDGVRRIMGRVGRTKARQHSIQENWREWHDVYSELVGGEFHATARKAISIGAVQKVSELAPFLELVSAHHPKTVVEIGTARGGTLWALAQHLPEDTHFISIDIPSGSPLDVGSDGEDVYKGRDRDRIKQLLRPGQKLSLIDMNSQLPMTKAVLMQALGDETIDLLFIDGDHRYEGVKADFENFKDLVSDYGLIAFHDIETHHDKRVGVSRFWNEIKQDRPHEEFFGPETWGYTPWGGIGVLFNG